MSGCPDEAPPTQALSEEESVWGGFHEEGDGRDDVAGLPSCHVARRLLGRLGWT